MTVRLMGIPTNLGLPGSEAWRGPAALRAMGLTEHLRRGTLPVTDLGDLPRPAATDAGLAAVAALAATQRARVTEVYRRDDLLLTIGGDHSSSLGSVSALRQMGEQFDLIWIDAHGDFNSPGTSPSGNPHGMVLAMLCGYSPGNPGWLDGRRVSILGARDLDPGEARLLRHAGVRTLPPRESLARLEELLTHMAPRVFLSFDLDSLDPGVAPGVSTPVAGGFDLDAVLRLVGAIARRRQIIGLDVVEYNPSRDPAGLTGRVALTVIDTVLSAQGQRLSPTGTAAD